MNSRAKSMVFVRLISWELQGISLWRMLLLVTVCYVSYDWTIWEDKKLDTLLMVLNTSFFLETTLVLFLDLASSKFCNVSMNHIYKYHVIFERSTLKTWEIYSTLELPKKHVSAKITLKMKITHFSCYITNFQKVNLVF